MTVRIDQAFPRCARCGKMINVHARRLAVTLPGGQKILLCSEICRDEYVALHGLSDRGMWEDAERRTQAGRR